MFRSNKFYYPILLLLRFGMQIRNDLDRYGLRAPSMEEKELAGIRTSCFLLKAVPLLHQQLVVMHRHLSTKACELAARRRQIERVTATEREL